MSKSLKIVIKCSKSKCNTLEANRKVESTNKEVEDIKRNSMEMLELKV